MARITRIEKRQRGIFGWIFLLLFWGFNAFMVLWVFGAISATSQLGASADRYEQAGRAIGTGIAFWFILSIWVMGDLILGVLMLLTRGRKVTIEETHDEPPVVAGSARQRRATLEPAPRKVIDVTPQIAPPPLRSPPPSAGFEQYRSACVTLKMLATVGERGLDEYAVGAILDYLEAEEGGTQMSRQQAAEVSRWIQALPSDGPSVQDAARRLPDEVNMVSRFNLAMTAIAGNPPSTDLQARWLKALQNYVGA